ncbi:protein phosphatase 2C domain-containing protein [Streptomyces lydicus]|nr:protein phosphatase 2C domain-containing protein [Streptomyces lydicus]
MPDTALEGAQYGSLTLRAASQRGDSARYRGDVRRDALLTARFGAGRHALILVAVATGRPAVEGAHRAARDACGWIGSAVGRSYTQLAEDIRADRRGDLKAGLQRLTDRSYGKLRARALERGGPPEQYTAALRCLLLPADPDCRTRVFFGVGAGGLFRLRDGAWTDLEPVATDHGTPTPSQPPSPSPTPRPAPARVCRTAPVRRSTRRARSRSSSTRRSAGRVTPCCCAAPDSPTPCGRSRPSPPIWPIGGPRPSRRAWSRSSPPRNCVPRATPRTARPSRCGRRSAERTRGPEEAHPGGGPRRPVGSWEGSQGTRQRAAAPPGEGATETWRSRPWPSSSWTSWCGRGCSGSTGSSGTA